MFGYARVVLTSERPCCWTLCGEWEIVRLQMEKKKKKMEVKVKRRMYNIHSKIHRMLLAAPQNLEKKRA